VDATAVSTDAVQPSAAVQVDAAAVSTDAVQAQQTSLYQGIFDRHNSYRALHATPALAWSTTLASNAASYAAQCYWGHSGAAGQGENLYAISGNADQATTLANAIKAW
jgi:uncharacterized protein YkwD